MICEIAKKYACSVSKLHMEMVFVCFSQIFCTLTTHFSKTVVIIQLMFATTTSKVKQSTTPTVMTFWVVPSKVK